MIQSTENITQANGSTVSISVSSTIVYTDYANIQLQVVCGQIPGSQEIYTDFLVLVRNRAFNNLRALLKVLDEVDEVDESQTITWLQNDASCKN